MMSQDSMMWAMTQFADADLGDRRRSKGSFSSRRLRRSDREQPCPGNVRRGPI